MNGADSASTANGASFTCLLCGAQEASLFLDNCRDYYMGKTGVFAYYNCARCRLTQLHPVPADMSPFYEAYQVHSRKSWLHETMRGKLMSKGYYLPEEGGSKLKVLDYGCGDGWYLASMKERGHSVAGFEANQQHADNLSRQLDVPVLAETAELGAKYAAAFDVVTMHFVVEHLSDLNGTFELANAVLKPGGLFYFMVPNIRSREAKLFRRKWHGLDPPRHLQFLTDEHVRDLAKRTGFEVADVRYFSLPNGFAGSVTAVLTGGFVYPLFAGLMLPSLVACAVMPDGNLAVTLRKPTT